MTETTPRLLRRIRVDFPDPGSAEEIARLVADAHESERVQAAIVLWGRGNLARIRDARALATQDWRDLLVRADLADADWHDKLDAQLGQSEGS
ncbi:hypothetical protein EV652_11941 [Kribbella steppae]|uniref:Uncharacterized protein n=1 Tax=Kribbella steppae TaxID=2512223 RepID=A0A4R2GZ07_9ACTN|nr:hypothetical protein [Kribbella steppae]TCO16852.1 hypothetical protein EV652_11941 [Kribbella steppae]